MASSRSIEIHNGISAPFHFPGQGNGVICTKDITIGEKLVSIPRQCLFTTFTVVSNEKLCRIVESSFSVSSNGRRMAAIEVLILGLLFYKYHTFEDSYWTEYIQTLPSHFNTLIFWKDHELNLLGSTLLVQAVKKRIQKIEALYANTKLHLDSNWLGDTPWFNPEEFKWAYTVLMSRSVFVKDAAKWKPNCHLTFYKDTCALPPFLDYFNHSNDASCTASYNPKSQAYELFTQNDWKEGEQVFIRYGNHSNDKLLMHYGFCIPNNIYESIPLKIPFSRLLEGKHQRLDKLLSFGLIDNLPSCDHTKHDFTESNNFQKSVIKHSINNDGIGWNTMVAIKTCLMTDSEFQQWDSLLEDVPISESNEKHYNDYVVSTLKVLLRECDQAEFVDTSNLPFDMELKNLASTFRNRRIDLLKKTLYP